MVQILTAAEIKAANRKALEDGTLGALKNNTGRYVYEDGCRCAIGVTLNNDTLEKVAEIERLRGSYLRIYALKREGIIEIKDEAESSWAAILQTLHDEWASSNGRGRGIVAERREHFMAWLDANPQDLRKLSLNTGKEISK